MRRRFVAVILVLFSILIVIFVLYKISRSRTFQFFGGLTSRVETGKKVIALTFDDGPTENTDKILTLLDELGVKATFFVTGAELSEDIERGRKIVAGGHELGNHTFSHPRMVFKTPAYIKAQIEKTDELIRQTGYQGEILFRPPGCKKLLLLPYYLRKHNRRTITWDIEPDSISSIQNDAGKMTENALQNVKPGSIILMHVMYESRKPSVEALPEIVNGLRDKGYRFVTLNELLKKGQ